MNAETGLRLGVGQRSGYSLSLQWGRVLMNAETRFHLGDVSAHVLQWGRVLMNAETIP